VYAFRDLLAQKPANYDVEALDAQDKDLRRALHASIKKVTEDVGERFNFNTAISSMMELVNAIYAYKDAKKSPNAGLVYEAVRNLLLLLAPFVPHITEELWQTLGETGSIHDQAWPKYDEAALKVDSIEIVLQVNGKNRDRLTIPSGASRSELEQIALASEAVKKHVGDMQVVKVICVPGRLVNVVAKPAKK